MRSRRRRPRRPRRPKSRRSRTRRRARGAIMDPKELALKHFEKGVLAGFAIWLLFSLISMAKPPAELAAKAKLDTQLGQIKDYMDTAQPPQEPPPTWVQDLSRLLDPKAVPTVENGAYPSWTAWRRPNLA